MLVKEFLAKINDGLSAIDGIKVDDMYQFHNKVGEILMPVVKEYKMLEVGVWAIYLNSKLAGREHLFEQSLSMIDDKRIKSAGKRKGTIIETRYRVTSPLEGKIENIPMDELEKYIDVYHQQMFLKQIDKRLVELQAEINVTEKEKDEIMKKIRNYNKLGINLT
jgi:hypothetical protein